MTVSDRWLQIVNKSLSDEKEEAKKIKNEMLDMEHKNFVPDWKIGKYEARICEDENTYPRTQWGEMSSGWQDKHRWGIVDM